MKQETRLKRIRDVLLQHGKVTWSQIQTKTGIPPKELSMDLKKLLKREVVSEQDTKDRRRTWYMLKSEKKALMESKRYETIEFIANMKEPIFYEGHKACDGFDVWVSIFGETEKLNRQVEQDSLKQLVDTAMALPLLETFGASTDSRIGKMALVFAYEKESVKP